MDCFRRVILRLKGNKELNVTQNKDERKIIKINAVANKNPEIDKIIPNNLKLKPTELLGGNEFVKRGLFDNENNNCKDNAKIESDFDATNKIKIEVSPISVKKLNSSDPTFEDVQINEQIKLKNKDVLVNSVTTEANSDIKSEIENNLCEVSADNLIANLEPQEWLNLDEFETIIKELNSASSIDNLDIEDVITTHTIVKKEKVHSNDSSVVEKRLKNCEINDNTEIDANNNASVNDDVICISSDDENDLPLNLSIDLDTISLDSIEAFNDNKVYSNNRTDPNTDGNKVECKKSVLKGGTESQLKQNSTKDIPSIEIEICEVEDTTEKVSKTVNEIVNNEHVISVDLAIAENSKANNDLDKIELDTISIASKDSGDDYDSSDFEFITESEAKSDGLIINYYRKSKRVDAKETCQTVEVTSDSGCNGSNYSQGSGSHDEMPGLSGQEVEVRIIESPSYPVDYREHHDMPQGNRYLDLFEGRYAPQTPYMFENKSMNSMLDLQYQGLGFDMRLLPRGGADDVGEQYKKEAEESAKIILNMYPEENRKRRRRF